MKRRCAAVRGAWILLLLVGPWMTSAQGQPVDATAALRDRLTKARKALTERGQSFNGAQRQSLDAALTEAEKALHRYDQLVERGDARKKAMTPLLITGGGLLADDATGVGAADDVLLPFVGIGIIAVYIGTHPAVSDTELAEAWKQVIDKSKAVGEVANRIAAERKKTCYCICGDPKAPITERKPLGPLPEWECRARCTLGEPYRYGQYTCL